MNAPTPCPQCGKVWSYADLVHPFNCPKCHDEDDSCTYRICPECDDERPDFDEERSGPDREGPAWIDEEYDDDFEA